MNKKAIKIISILLIVMTIVSISVSSFAVKFDDVATTMNTAADKTDSTKIANVGGNIVGILQTIGVVIAIVILIVLGIKYMMGSAEEKAEYKKTMIPYLVGALLIFAASAIAGVVVNFVTNISA